MHSACDENKKQGFEKIKTCGKEKGRQVWGKPAASGASMGGRCTAQLNKFS